jgi:carbonic anhydrase
MQKLIQGVHHFQTNTFHPQRELFERLAKHQEPEVLFIACSDSRVDPGLLTNTRPGELFVLRNAGNLAPPHDPARPSGAAATVEFAVAALGVKNIVVCGHTQCGAMKGLIDPQALAGMPAVAAWLSLAEGTRRILRESYRNASPEELLTAAVKENVLVQLENLCTLPCVASRLVRGALSLHGWVYEIESGAVFAYDPEARQFVPLADAYRPPLPPSAPAAGHEL